jgi:hypothetical protein
VPVGGGVASVWSEQPGPDGVGDGAVVLPDPDATPGRFWVDVEDEDDGDDGGVAGEPLGGEQADSSASVHNGSTKVVGFTRVMPTA